MPGLQTKPPTHGSSVCRSCGQAEAPPRVRAESAPTQENEATKGSALSRTSKSLDEYLDAFLSSRDEGCRQRSDTARSAMRIVDDVGMPMVVRVRTEASLAAEAIAGVTSLGGVHTHSSDQERATSHPADQDQR